MLRRIKFLPSARIFPEQRWEQTVFQSGKINVRGHIDVPASELNDFAAALGEHFRLSRAEPGCLLFEIVKAAGKPGRFLVKETFVDRAAFDIHTGRSRTSEWWAKTGHIARHLSVRET